MLNHTHSLAETSGVCCRRIFTIWVICHFLWPTKSFTSEVETFSVCMKDVEELLRASFHGGHHDSTCNDTVFTVFSFRLGWVPNIVSNQLYLLFVKDLLSCMLAGWNNVPCRKARPGRNVFRLASDVFTSVFVSFARRPWGEFRPVSNLFISEAHCVR